MVDSGFTASLRCECPFFASVLRGGVVEGGGTLVGVEGLGLIGAQAL